MTATTASRSTRRSNSPAEPVEPDRVDQAGGPATPGTPHASLPGRRLGDAIDTRRARNLVIGATCLVAPCGPDVGIRQVPDRPVDPRSGIRGVDRRDRTRRGPDLQGLRRRQLQQRGCGDLHGVHLPRAARRSTTATASCTYLRCRIRLRSSRAHGTPSSRQVVTGSTSPIGQPRLTSTSATVACRS